MKKIDNINAELFSICHPIASKVSNSKIARALLSGLKIFGNISGVESENIDNLTKSISSFLKNDCAVLVLDDFERCRIDLQELFAYITSLVIENGIKVILVGNDVEVRRYLQEESTFRAKLIASNISSKPEELEENLKKLEEPLLYDSIKEKCVYKSFSFEFDSSVLFEKILPQYPKSVGKMMLSSKRTIERILESYKCENLRTCKVALDLFCAIKTRLHKRFENDFGVKKKLLMTTFLYTVLLKNGKSMDGFSEEFYGINTRVYPMKSVGLFVFKSSWDKEAIVKELESIDKEISVLINKEMPESIRKINDVWYVKSDSQIKEEIYSLLGELDVLPFTFYHHALTNFIVYKQWYPDDDVINPDSIFKIMENKINQTDGEIDYNEDRYYYEESEEVHKLLRQLIASFKEHNASARLKKLSTTKFSIEKYSIEDFKKIEQNAYLDHCFFSKVDVSELMATIEEGDGSTIFRVRSFLHNVYRISNLKAYFEADLEKLVLFDKELTKCRFDSVVKTKALELLKKDVKGYIEILKSNT